MPPERWEEIKRLVAEAQELPAADRAAYLDRSCNGDTGIRREAESLLAALDGAVTDPLEKPAVAELPPVGRDSMEGRRIGPYRLLHRIGSGGMGDVYVAARDDDQFHKRVAIKLVKPSLQEGDQILRRFRTERQALAALDHPNIVKLLDAGTTAEGLPYLVMDYVEGVPIDLHCDRHRLSITERLKLFATVCQAVHYAHQNLVIHRDLKPGNILVTADGVPKLLDFGIAKLLNPEMGGMTIHVTRADARPMTPLYASPEQLRGEPVTTASDVYSLGVILYQLLTGHGPYGAETMNSLFALERAICEVQPEKPSNVITRIVTTSEPGKTPVTPERVSETREGHPQKLRRRLTGDLDVIALMAMRKEPRRRYASAEQLAGDIRRHLDGLPVIARDDTATYRITKFVQRNRTAVAAAAIAVVALLGGTLVSIGQARRAEREQARAERRFNDVRKLANWFLFDFHQMIQDLPGSTPARKQLVSKSLEYLDGLAKEAAGDTLLQAELARAYMKVGEVQFDPTAANLGDPAGGLASLEKAVDVARRAQSAMPDNAQMKRTLAQSYQGLATMQGVRGKTQEAVENLRQACAMFGTLKTAGDMGSAVDVVRCLTRLGDSLGHPYFPNLGDGNGALDAYQKALAISENVSSSAGAAERRNLRLPQLLYGAYQRVGDIYHLRRGEHREALTYYQRALKEISRLIDDEPTNAPARRNLGIIHHRLGQVWAELADFPQADEHHEKALAINTELAAADPKNAEARRSLSLSYEKIGNSKEKAGDAGKALEAYRKSVEMREATHAADPANLTARRDLAVALRNVAKMQFALKQPAPGAENFAQAIKHYRGLVEAEPGNGPYRAELVQEMGRLAALLEQSGVTSEAQLARERWREQLKTFAEREGATEADKRRWREALGPN